MMLNNAADITTVNELLAQILPLPSEQVVANRFDNSNDGGTCGTNCSGECHGFV